MSTINYLTVRNTVLPVVNATRVNYSTLTGSTITATSMNLTSASVALGASTNQTYNNFSNGSYAPPWITAKEALSSTNKTVMSANGLYQMIVGNATSGLFLSSDSGITWTALTGGLPTLTGSAYWSDGAISANGQYITLSIYGGSLWMSADYGRTFALTNQPTPSIWLPLNGNTTDLMGSSTVTVTGSPSYVTLNYPGYTAQAVNLANTAGGTATRYVRGTWTGASNFTVSGWVNPQALNSTYQGIFSAYTGKVAVSISDINTLYATIPTGGGTNFTSLGFYTLTLTVNTWYYFTLIFQTNGLCSFYVNNNLIASATNVGGVGSFTTTQFSLGTYDSAIALSFNGYVDDLRITNSVSTYVPIPLLQPNIWLPFENTAGDLGSHSLAPGATPTIYLPFEGNLTDSMNPATPATPTGPVTYVAANREGYTGQAIRLTNTAGGTAAQYVRGNWTGSANFTVSFWFNAPSSGGNFQLVFAAYNSSLSVALNGDNSLTMYIPNASYILSGVLSINTWHFVTCIFQTNGTCSFYIDNSLIGTATNTGGFGTSSGFFELSGADNSQIFAFNGTIDDFRFYNYAITYTPVSIVTVTGSLSYVPGVVGLNAVNLVNTAGGSATNYITVPWSVTPNFTISMWFNLQSVGGSYIELLSADTNGYLETFIVVSTMNVHIQVPGGGTQIQVAIAPVVLNTWYHLVQIFQTNGTCSVFLNGVSIGSGTNTSGTTGTSWTNLTIGRETATNSSAFNGYIDDLRIYNAAIPYHVLFPQNYRSLALSGTGQYALASAASGWVVGSSDSSRTWSKQAVCVGTQSEFIQPNITGLGANTWIANGVTWTASANAANLPAYNAFNNNFTTGNNWLGQLGPGQYNASGVYTGTASTTILGIGSIGGEWVQIQSSVPLILSNYSYAVGGKFNQPKTMYIVGSADGLTNWQPLQLHVLAANPFTTDFTAASTYIIVNYTGTQTVTAQTSQTVTTTSYASTTQAFTYFRFIINTNFLTSVDCGALGELYLNFVPPLTVSRPSASMLSLNHTGQYQLVATGPASGSIMPNQTGLLTNTWSQGGVTWGVSASSVLAGGWNPYTSFNNSLGSDFNVWASSGGYNNSGTYTGSLTTTVSGIGAVAGEWLQLQSSVPLVMASYIMSSANASNPNKSYVIAGSNDGIIWYAIQSASWAANPFGGYTTLTSYINANFTGTQSLTSNSTQNLITTSYVTSTNAYLYFRAIGTANFSSAAPSQYYEIGEWFINFQNSVSYSSNYGATWLNTRSTVSNESVALSPSGQYVLSTNSVAPFARLTLDNTNVDAQGVLAAPTVVGSSFSYDTNKVVGTHSINFANTAGATSSLTYLNYTVPSTLYLQNILTMACWIYPTANPASGNPCPMGFNNGSTSPATLFQIIAGTNYINFSAWTTTGGSASISTTTAVTLNTWTHLVGTFSNGVLSFYVNGVLQGIANVTGSLSVLGGTNMTNLFIGAAYTTWGGFRGNVDDVRIYTSALNADEVNGLFRNPALTQTIAVSNSYLPITSYTEPVLPGITANVVDTAVSQTGQYMVAVTSSTTNNVYYSTDFGATFTALTIGSSAMVSCSISYDGTYLTVTNATTTYTLNENTRGFALAIGNQAGRINQGLNAIAIGDKAGQTNQSNNSIVLNATGAALDAVVPGFYVAPVVTADSSSLGSFSVLGYGTDSQVVQTGLRVLQNGSVGIGSATPTSYFQVANGLTSEISGSFKTQYTSLGYTAATLASPNAANGSISGPINGVYTFTLNSGGQDAYYNGLLPAGALVQISITVRSSSSNVYLAIASGSYASIYYSSPALTNTLTTYTFTARITSSTQLFIRLIGGSNGSSWSWSDFSVQRMDTLMTGNVGIGTANPGFTLDVWGTIVSRGSYQQLGAFMKSYVIPGIVGGASFGVIGGGGNSVPSLYLTDSGNVGIGTTSPGATLDLLGTCKIRGVAHATSGYIQSLNITNINGGGPYSSWSSISAVHEGSLVNILKLSPGGYATFIGGYVYLDFYTTNGTVITTNSVGQLAVSSDRRIKENIEYLSDTQQGLTSILNLKPATYSLIGSSGTYLGFIAQDLEQDIPLAVDGKKYEWQWELTEDGKPKFDDNGDIVYKLDADGNRIVRPRGVMDRAIIAVQTLAIQELSKQLSSIQEQLAEKSSKLDALQAANAATSSQMAALLAWAQTQGFSGTF
jgi:hypothetical protein